MATTLTRWTPLADLAELRDRFDRVFDEVTNGGERAWAPRVDLVREKDRMVLRADIPGIKPDEVDISVEDDVLTISGAHEESKEEKDKDFVRRERRYGSFSRTMALPEGVDSKQIEATCTDGVLEVSIPAPAEKKGKKVHIKPQSGSGG